MNAGITRRFSSPVLSLIIATSVLFSGARADERVEIYNLRSHVHPNFTRIVVDIGSLREYFYDKVFTPDRLFVDIYQAKLNPILHGKSYPIPADYIHQIRIAQKTLNGVRIVIDLDFKKIKNYQIFHLFDPFRVVIDIFPIEKESKKSPPTPASQPPQKPVDTSKSMVRQLGLGVHRVVIDPGHGGKDPGCIGSSGLKEKEVALKLALYLKDLLLQNKDLEVVLTRETDISVAIEDRTVIANQKEADIFVSIHVNAHKNKKLYGIESFYLNFSEDPSVNETAARENATSTKNISEMADIITSIVNNSKIIESKALTRTIHSCLVQRMGQDYDDIKDNGVKGGPFWVLIGGEMPSTLVEVSYMSNAQDEQRLRSTAYLKRIAQGIYDGIMEYIKSLGKG